MTSSSLASQSSKPASRADLEALAEALAELDARKTRRAESLLEFAPRVSPELIRPTYLAKIADVFRRIEQGERVRVCISVPPQHGKTEMVLHGIVQLLSLHPSWSFGYATYQQDQSDDKSDRARGIARRAGVQLSETRANLRQWRTAQGGGCLFTSVGGPLTGQGAKALFFDDPYKNRATALSEAVRREVWSFFQSAAMTRGQEGMSVVVIHTRWVQDDLIGQLSTQGWEVIDLPFLMDASGNAALPDDGYANATHVLNSLTRMPDGSVFGWSLRGAVQHLRDIDVAVAEALYQNRPRRRVDGALWSHESILHVDKAPALSRTIVVVDPNAADEASAAKADNAGIVCMARGTDQRGYILADATGHMSIDGWARRAISLYRKHNAASIVVEKNHGGAMVEKSIRAVLLQEALSAGRRQPDPIPIKSVTVKGDKRGRAESARELYADPVQGRGGVVSHVGTLSSLETSMCTHDFATTSKSPGDIDALSLGLSELMLGGAVADSPVEVAAAMGDVSRRDAAGPARSSWGSGGSDDDDDSGPAFSRRE